MCFTAPLKLNVKKCRENLQKVGRKVETTGFTRFHNTSWNKIVSDRTSYYIDGSIHFVFAKKPTLSKFFVTRTPKSKPFIITLPKYTVLIH